MNTKAKHSSRSRTQKLWLLDHHFPCRARPLVTTVWQRNMWIGLPEKIIPQRFLEEGWHLSGLYPMPHSWWHIFWVSPVPSLPELGRLIMVHLQRPSANVTVFYETFLTPCPKRLEGRVPSLFPPHVYCSYFCCSWSGAEEEAEQHGSSVLFGCVVQLFSVFFKESRHLGW